LHADEGDPVTTICPEKRLRRKIDVPCGACAMILPLESKHARAEHNQIDAGP